MEGWTVFTFSRDATRKTNVLVLREVPVSKEKAVAFVNELWLAHPHLPLKS